MIDKIKCKYRVGNDSHPQLIALLKALQRGWIPPETISEEEYNRVRENKEDYPDYYVGLVGFCCTFGSKYFGGFARGKTDKGIPRDYYQEAVRNLKKQLPAIQDVQLINKDYLDIDMSKLHGAVIYCDPPYRDTTKYETDQFDHEKFYDWCREVAKTNLLLVSEYQMPEDFVCIWSKNTTTSLDVSNNRHKDEQRVEKLFMIEPQKYGVYT